MSRKTGNAQSRATFFPNSAILSVTAVLLRKLPIIQPVTAVNTSWLKLVT